MSARLPQYVYVCRIRRCVSNFLGTACKHTWRFEIGGQNDAGVFCLRLKFKWMTQSTRRTQSCTQFSVARRSHMQKALTYLRRIRKRSTHSLVSCCRCCRCRYNRLNSSHPRHHRTRFNSNEKYFFSITLSRSTANLSLTSITSRVVTRAYIINEINSEYWNQRSDNNYSRRKFIIHWWTMCVRAMWTNSFYVSIFHKIIFANYTFAIIESTQNLLRRFCECVCVLCTSSSTKLSINIHK